MEVQGRLYNCCKKTQLEGPAKTNSLYNELLRTAKRRPEFAEVLEAVFSHPVIGRALLISQSELFRVFNIQSGKLGFQFRATGLPYLSHGHAALLSSWQEHSLFLNEQLRRRQKILDEPIQQLESSGPDLRDHLLLAAFATLQKNPILLKLANRTEPVDITQLRQAVRDYSSVDFSAFESLMLDTLPIFLKRPKLRKAINRLTMNLDSFIHVSDKNHVKQLMVWDTASRFIELLRVRRISETQWRSLIVGLSNCGLLEPSSLIYIWCPRCRGAGFTMATTITECDLPPFCNSCAREAHAIATLLPSGPLCDAMLAPDGLLGVAVAWHLRKNHFRFEAAKHTGTTELDFLVTTSHGSILLECKMLHALSDNLIGNLWSSRNQLRDHINALISQEITPYKAACIVNIPARELRSLLRTLSPEAAAEFRNIRGEIISYDRFPKWLESQCSARR